ncbi:alpha/beta fold hydrolase [Enterococcus sp. DIV0840]|uniref:alpha/beta hydrolase n=2 Tax=unclassified Enterococcus TaxID=2608891 RepID=UPI003D2FB39F
MDNQSDKTAVVQHGYRSNPMNLMMEAEFLYELGYNVIIPDARSHGKSEGSYITFGVYERNDINAWINQELETKPNQKFLLFGVSMGAATVMMSQETPHPNVEAIIEDCGYYSIEQQARDVMRLLTSKLQYIPLVNQIDWYNCENELIDALNNEFVKPILKIDLFSISPLDAVSKSNVPKLFIHGTADWFIPPVAKDKLFTAALGYKEQLAIPDAGHSLNLQVGGTVYKEKVRSFLGTVSQIKTLRPQLAEDKNLLINPEFKRNEAQTSFNAWQLSNDGINFNSITESTPYEFVLSRYKKDIISTLSTDHNGLKFYKKWKGSAAYVAQEVSLLKGQPYELSFDSYNPNPTEYSQQVIKYGFDQTLKQEKQTSKNIINKKMAFTPQTTGPKKIILGSEMTYYSLFGRTSTIMHLSNVKLINADKTAPEQVKVSEIVNNSEETLIKGQGEPETLVQILSANSEMILESSTDSNGNFSLTIPKQQTGTILHMINKDIKGNTSASVVLVSN